METNLEKVEEKVPKSEIVYDTEVRSCRCSELEERSKKAEARCVELELEVQCRKSEYEALESKCKTLEVAKLALEDEIKVLKSQNYQFRDLISHCANRYVVGVAGDLIAETDGENKVFQLMAENKVLECEKNQAEKGAEIWKKTFTELEDKCTGSLQPAGNGTPFIDTPYKQFTYDEGDSSREWSNKRVKRHLAFQDKRSLIKKMAPSTPSGAKPASVSIIDIQDSDEEPDSAPSTIKQDIGKGNISTYYESEGTVGSESKTKISGDQNQEEKVSGYMDNVSFVSIPKRKRALNMVTSDTETDDDDNIPIGIRRRMRSKQVVPDQTDIKSKSCTVAAKPPGIYYVRSTVTPRKRRLVSLRQCEGKMLVKNCSSKRTSKNECHKSIPTTLDVDDDDSEEIGSDNESDSLNGFIVDDSDVADGDNDCSESAGGSNSNNDHSGGSNDVSSGNDAYSVSKDVSDDDVDMDMILSQLKRNKDQKSEWKFEADLLAAFGKDPELCMKAVCALYRQQTSGEKLCKATFLNNQRGFSKFDALRGCNLAEFLTDGDPQGDLLKSVKELQEYDPKAVEICRDLAIRYSKQLFEIYNNKEDPYFRSS